MRIAGALFPAKSAPGRPRRCADRHGASVGVAHDRWNRRQNGVAKGRRSIEDGPAVRGANGSVRGCGASAGGGPNATTSNLLHGMHIIGAVPQRQPTNSRLRGARRGGTAKPGDELGTRRGRPFGGWHWHRSGGGGQRTRRQGGIGTAAGEGSRAWAAVCGALPLARVIPGGEVVVLRIAARRQASPPPALGLVDGRRSVPDPQGSKGPATKGRTVPKIRTTASANVLINAFINTHPRATGHGTRQGVAVRMR